MAGIFRSTRIVKQFNEFWKDGRYRQTQTLARPEVLEKSENRQKAIAALEKQRWSLLNTRRSAFIAENEAAFKAAAATITPARQLKAWEAEEFSGHKNLRTVAGKYSPAMETRVPLEQWVQYDFTLDEAGSFLLYLRYATPVAGPLKLELNQVILEEALPIANTGGVEYQNYRWQAFGPFPFQEGANRIRLLVDQHRTFPRLDALKIVKEDRPAPEKATRPGFVAFFPFPNLLAANEFRNGVDPAAGRFE